MYGRQLHWEFVVVTSAFADMLGKWDDWGAGDWTSMVPFGAMEEQLKWGPLIFEETRKYTNDELVTMSIEY